MMTAHELFGFMSPRLAGEILEWMYSTDKNTYRAALQGVAQTRKVRPQFLERKPRTERHVMMAQSFTRPGLEPVAATVLRAWLTGSQAALLCDFLDALELKHDKGVLEDLPDTMEEDKLQNAVNMILAKHDQEAVAVYLNAFNSMNDTSWTNLDTMLKNDERLQLHG